MFGGLSIISSLIRTLPSAQESHLFNLPYLSHVQARGLYRRYGITPIPKEIYRFSSTRVNTKENSALEKAESDCHRKIPATAAFRKTFIPMGKRLYYLTIVRVSESIKQGFPKRRRNQRFYRPRGLRSGDPFP